MIDPFHGPNSPDSESIVNATRRRSGAQALKSVGLFLIGLFCAAVGVFLGWNPHTAILGIILFFGGIACAIWGLAR
jgi:hypothetical protein